MSETTLYKKDNTTSPSYYAFFDVDGTVIRIKTMFSFLKYFYGRESKILGGIRYALYMAYTSLLECLGVSREYLNKRYYKQFKNLTPHLLNRLGEEWFENIYKEDKALFFTNILKEIKKHQAQGGEIVFVSGSFPACLLPIASLLKINHILSTNLEKKDGVFTGNILPHQTIGLGKAKAVLSFLKDKKFNFHEKCFAYGDHHSDFAMLNVVGNSYLVSTKGLLQEHSKS